ncbi:ANTAR domain-containing protein [Kineococcus sp. R8]|uniref:ANTAR domain-containing protein n=1 Tax=Kineococcus siccus TaxID=2696567 RepID=UPI0014134B25|nr:ANTAR domain-containing protein [Kineococcus siccus]
MCLAGCYVDETFRLLAKHSQSSNRKLRDLAAGIVAAAACGRQLTLCHDFIAERTNLLAPNTTIETRAARSRTRRLEGRGPPGVSSWRVSGAGSRASVRIG